MPELAERTDREHYLAGIEALHANKAPAWLSDLRDEGARVFGETDLPNYKMELWRSTDVRPIAKTQFNSQVGGDVSEVDASAVAPYLYDTDWTQLVFVDGQYSAALSKTGALPDGVTVTSLAAAIADGHPAVRERLGQSLVTTNAYVALNTALIHDGLLVHVPRGTTLENPIHALYVSSSSEALATHPRNLVVIDESAEATLLESYVGLNDTVKNFTNPCGEIVVGDNATFTRHKLVREGDASFHLDTTHVTQGRDTTFNSHTVTLSGQIVRNECCVLMQGENAECELNGLYLNDRDRLIDNALNVEHDASRCRSRMGYKGVLDDESQAVFTGKVYVHRDAQQTDSDQLNNNLLLSDKAAIDTRPQLEIFADDVKCTHGATIGGFPDQLIFYFMSRGISRAMAFGVLTYGFAQETIDEIGVDALRDRMSEYAFAKYEAKD